jgi:hypothetical protein
MQRPTTPLDGKEEEEVAAAAAAAAAPAAAAGASGRSTLTVLHYRSKGTLQLVFMLLHLLAFVGLVAYELFVFFKVRGGPSSSQGRGRCCERKFVCCWTSCCLFTCWAPGGGTPAQPAGPLGCLRRPRPPS